MATATTLWLTPDNKSLFEMTGSADWQPVQAWEKDELTGKSRPSSRQQMDPAGLPVWEVRVIALQDTYGRREEAFLTLKTASATKPEREMLTMIGVVAS